MKITTTTTLMLWWRWGWGDRRRERALLRLLKRQRASAMDATAALAASLRTDDQARARAAVRRLCATLLAAETLLRRLEHDRASLAARARGRQLHAELFGTTCRPLAAAGHFVPGAAALVQSCYLGLGRAEIRA